MVAGINPGDTAAVGILILFTAWRKQVPAQGPVANACFEHHHRTAGGIRHKVPNAQLRANGFLDRVIDAHPFVVHHL